MASLQGVKRRIRSVRNTRQITRAMQLVAASKLRRAQEAAAAPREYVAASRAVLARLAATDAARTHPLFSRLPEATGTLYIVVAGDRGLAGAYNTNVVRELASALNESTASGSTVICVGRYAAQAISRIGNLTELAAYALEGEDADVRIATPVLKEAMSEFLAGRASAVELVYTQYVSTVRQRVVREQILPLGLLPKPETAHPGILEVVVDPTVPNPEPELEPTAAALIDQAVHQLGKGLVLSAVLEAAASEQAARMVAMMNATDNAGQLIGDLTLEYNNARQAAITQQISEISGGAEAMA